MAAAASVTTLALPVKPVTSSIITADRTAEDLGIMGLHMVASLNASREATVVRLDVASDEREKQTEAIKLLADQVAALAGEVKALREESSFLRERLDASERARTEGIEALSREVAALGETQSASLKRRLKDALRSLPTSAATKLSENLLRRSGLC